MAFMKPQIYEGDYFEIDTTCGTEIIPAELGFSLDYLEGTPLDSEEVIEPKHGWLARMSAPGYMDCTSWSAHQSYEEAATFLEEMYGEDNELP